MRLEEKTALVTGASSGIGRGIALAFASEGAAVVNGDIRPTPKPGKHTSSTSDTPTHEIIAERGGDATFIETDVSNADQCQQLVRETVEEHGGVDVLVNNAATHVTGNAEELSVDDWQTVVDVNLSGQFYCTKYALPHLREEAGSILNITSVQAFEGGSGPPYAASKAGIVNLTREVATEYSPENVTVNAIAPGPVLTPNWNYLSEAEVEEAKEKTLVPRLGQPEDVANAAVFLASDDAEWITGQTLFVDGGWTAHR